MNNKIKWTLVAADDLKNIIDYIVADSKRNAEIIFQGIKALSLTLSLFPEKGRYVPELKEYGVLLYRELLYGFWRIIYKIEGNFIYIMSVLDGRRNLSDLLFERFLR